MLRHALLLTTAILYTSNPTDAALCDVTPAFSPSESVSSFVVRELSKATQSIHISSYGLSNPDIVNILIQKHREGVDVELLEDKQQAAGRNSLLPVLRQEGVYVLVKTSNKLEHNKYIIIDNKTVLMGSWNLSRSADSQDNSEVLLNNCPGVIQSFEKDFQRIKVRDSKGASR